LGPFNQRTSCYESGARDNREHYNKERKLNKLASVNMFVIKDKTISDAKILVDAISY